MWAYVSTPLTIDAFSIDKRLLISLCLPGVQAHQKVKLVLPLEEDLNGSGHLATPLDPYIFPEREMVLGVVGGGLGLSRLLPPLAWNLPPQESFGARVLGPSAKGGNVGVKQCQVGGQ